MKKGVTAMTLMPNDMPTKASAARESSSSDGILLLKLIPGRRKGISYK